MLHFILQRLKITPDELMEKPPAVRSFIFASMMAQLEAEAEAQNKAKG